MGMMRRNGDSWLISDMYLDGAISEVATRHSEFVAILKSQGIDGLIAALNRKAVDRQYADRIISAVGDDRERPGPVDCHARRLLAGLNRGDLGGWRCCEVDHIELVVRDTLPIFTVFDPSGCGRRRHRHDQQMGVRCGRRRQQRGAP